MTLSEIKRQVYDLTCTETTKQLKQERPDLTKNQDLRYKKNWQSILDEIQFLKQSNLDISLQDLENSEQMLKESLLSIGRLSGLSDESIEVDWQRIKLTAQFSDIHIENL